jgi:uncharacterized membrane protein
MNKRMGYLVGGAALILLGVFLPREWYDALPPSRGDLPLPPIKGVTLLQITFVIEGLALIWLSRKRWRFSPLLPHERLPQTTAREDEHDIRASTSLWLLAGITLGALALRLVRLNADLWLDEITPILLYGPMPVLHIVTSYISSNNHLLNTLLMKLMLAFFGEQEWAVRLPAMLFGTATIPAIYWVSRFALSRRASLCVAVLLAASYHHIFFSQNARGYTAYLFFSVLSSGLLVKGLQEDRARHWVFYILTMFLCFASLLNSGFVFASHLLVAVIALFVVKHYGASPLPLARRLAAVFTVTFVLVLNLYITIVPQVYVYSKNVYSDPATGFSPLSAEFLRELLRGLSAGFGPALLLGIVPFVVVAATGFIVLLRRQWALTLALALPGFLTAVFLLVQGLNFSPRFFLLGLPLAILAGVQGIYSFVALLSGRLGITSPLFVPRVATVLVLIGIAVSLVSLRRYYSVPKQAYRASLQYVEAERQRGEPIIAIYIMEMGYRFYGKKFGLKEGQDWFAVRSIESLERVLATHRGPPPIVVTTFARTLRISYPDLLARISEGWMPARTFPATIGDGEISVWKPRTIDRQMGSHEIPP